MKQTALIFFILLYIGALSQSIEKSTFIDSLNQHNPYQEIAIAKELSNGNFIFTCTTFQLFQSNVVDMIVMVDSKGNSLASLVLPTDSFTVYSKLRISSITEMGDSFIFAQSCITKPDSVPAIIYYITDNRLNLTRFGFHKMKTEPGQNYQAYNHLSPAIHKHPDGGYYAILPVNNFHPDAGNELGVRTYFRLDDHFNLQHCKTRRTKRENGASNLIYDETSLLYFSGSVDGTSYLLDSNFNEISTQPSFLMKEDSRFVPETRSSLKKWKDSYILSGTFSESVKAFPNRVIDSAYYNYSYTLIKKLNASFVTTDSLCIKAIASDSGTRFGSRGWDKYGVTFQSMDFSTNNNLYFAYFDATAYILGPPGSYTLFSTDSMFNIRWAKKIIFDEVIELFYIMATKDGGCLVIGVTHNVGAAMFIAKHNESGERTWVKSISNSQTPVELYPNPASSFLYINVPVPRAQVSLFNMEGKTVLRQTIEPGKPIDIQSMKSGLYFYKISDNSAVIRTGKVLVEK